MIMKNIFASSFALTIVFFIMAFRPLPGHFEGTIRYETAVTGVVPKPVTDRLAKYYDLSFKKNDLKITGTSPLKGEILIKKDLQKMYIVRLDEKNVYEVDLNDNRIPENTSTPTVIPFKETMTIAGYACQKYQIQYDNDVTLCVWTTPAINADHWSGAPVFGGQLKLPDGVAGFPLRLELVSSKFTVTATAIAVKATEMNAMEFGLPAGMTMKKL
jgi:Domain of unknown function (DUF4412)